MPDAITISPKIQSGEPVFTNTRVPVKNLFDYLKAGHALNDFLEDFPPFMVQGCRHLSPAVSPYEPCEWRDTAV